MKSAIAFKRTTRALASSACSALLITSLAHAVDLTLETKTPVKPGTTTVQPKFIPGSAFGADHSPLRVRIELMP